MKNTNEYNKDQEMTLKVISTYGKRAKKLGCEVSPLLKECNGFVNNTSASLEDFRGNLMEVLWSPKNYDEGDMEAVNDLSGDLFLYVVLRLPVSLENFSRILTYALTSYDSNEEIFRLFFQKYFDFLSVKGHNRLLNMAKGRLGKVWSPYARNN